MSRGGRHRNVRICREARGSRVRLSVAKSPVWMPASARGTVWSWRCGWLWSVMKRGQDREVRQW